MELCIVFIAVIFDLHFNCICLFKNKRDGNLSKQGVFFVIQMIIFTLKIKYIHLYLLETIVIRLCIYVYDMN